MFYGFETTEDWLANYTEKNRTSCNIPSKGRLFDFNYALWILQQRSGIRKLNCTRVLSHNTPIPPRCEKHQKGLPFRNAEATYIISICSSREKSFLRRPNERQVDLLKQIMDGQEPMWWVDYANGVWYIGVRISHNDCGSFATKILTGLSYGQMRSRGSTVYMFLTITTDEGESWKRRLKTEHATVLYDQNLHVAFLHMWRLKSWPEGSGHTKQCMFHFRTFFQLSPLSVAVVTALPISLSTLGRIVYMI